jgi:hypothetical protein
MTRPKGRYNVVAEELRKEECELLGSISTAIENIEKKVGEKPYMIKLCNEHLDELDKYARKEWGNKGSMLGTKIFNRTIVQEALNRKERCIICEDK